MEGTLEALPLDELERLQTQATQRMLDTQRSPNEHPGHCNEVWHLAKMITRRKKENSR